MSYMPGARVRHVDGAQGTVSRTRDDGTVWIKWDDGSENDWSPDEQESMIRTGTLPPDVWEHGPEG